jgi:hypothetical protein
MNQVTAMANICDQSSGMGPGMVDAEPVESGEEAQRARQADGDGGDGGRLGHGKPGPHVEEGGGVAVRAAQVDVFAAGVGQHGAQFGVGHGAEEREQSADDPGEIDQGRGADVLHHLARHKEDAAADDGADDNGRGLADAPRTRGKSAGVFCGCAEWAWLMR